jgi:hypothetical protein
MRGRGIKETMVCTQNREATQTRGERKVGFTENTGVLKTARNWSI